MEQNLYYGAGLISNYDKYPEHKKAVAVKYPKRKTRTEDTTTKPVNYQLSDMLTDATVSLLVVFFPQNHIISIIQECVEDFDNGVDIQIIEEDSSKTSDIRKIIPKHVNSATAHMLHKKNKSKKFKDEESKRKWEEMMQIKRRKIFTAIVKKEVSKQQRSKVNKHKEQLIQCKKVALQCQRVLRNKAVSRFSTVIPKFKFD